MFCNIPKQIPISKSISTKVEKKITFTKPKALFDEISLISLLEENNIGRPSTYSTIIPGLLEKEYIIKEKKRLLTTKKGDLLGFVLQQNFSNIFELGFTKKMEENLNNISIRKLKKEDFLNNFLFEFSPLVDKFEKYVNKDVGIENKNFSLSYM